MINSLEGKVLEKNGLLDGKGYVKVITVGPENHPEGRYPEYLIAKAARASYDDVNKSAKADKGLIEYLVRHAHTSPLEMCSITFLLKLPVAICRQLLRHRTGKFNEFSQRYCEVDEKMGRFKLKGYSNVMRGKSKINHQASEFNLNVEQTEKIDTILDKMENLQDQVHDCYQELREAGLANELARFYLSTGYYTKIYVQFDLNNLLKFFKLRCAPDAQLEIQVYANAMRELAEQFFPISIGIYHQYQGALLLGIYEKQMIKEGKIPEEVTSKTHRAYLQEVANDLGLKLN
jgi:thymidylate synthase (FAD)